MTNRCRDRSLWILGGNQPLLLNPLNSFHHGGRALRQARRRRPVLCGCRGPIRRAAAALPPTSNSSPRPPRRAPSALPWPIAKGRADDVLRSRLAGPTSPAPRRPPEQPSSRATRTTGEKIIWQKKRETRDKEYGMWVPWTRQYTLRTMLFGVENNFVTSHLDSSNSTQS
jgi:hypothetical protein